MAMITVLLKTHLINRLVVEKAYLLKEACKHIAGAQFVLCCDGSSLKISSDEKSWLESNFDTFFFGGAAEYRQLDLPMASDLVLQGKPVNWYHAEYFLYQYLLSGNSRSKNYWLVEYDVYLAKGHWEDVLQQGGDCDLVASALIQQSSSAPVSSNRSAYPVRIDWPWWNHFQGPSPKIGCFFPIVRMSDRLVETLLSRLDHSNIGYSEVRVPSIAFEMGGEIADLSAVCDPASMLIMHPHWDKRYKDNLALDLLLNKPTSEQSTTETA